MSGEPIEWRFNVLPRAHRNVGRVDVSIHAGPVRFEVGLSLDEARELRDALERVCGEIVDESLQRWSRASIAYEARHMGLHLAHRFITLCDAAAERSPREFRDPLVQALHGLNRELVRVQNYLVLVIEEEGEKRGR